jgi:glucose-6-phosphate 1-dehydrogenase
MSGDLARIKLIPALAQLYRLGQLDNVAAVVGTGRGPIERDQLLTQFKLAPDGFGSMVDYHQGTAGLKAWLEARHGACEVVFFLALPPEVYGRTARELCAEGFREDCRLVVEKPFGYDLGSAIELNAALRASYREEQIYRIDHYLAKDAIQNILVFRFTNTIFQPIWSNHYIEEIQISATETAGIRNRGAYFDHAGIIRDMVQNHLTQLLCLLAMEAPASLSADDIRAEKLSVLKTLKVESFKKFQYAGYRDDPGVAPDSLTDTYAELKLSINNFRWAGVPIHLRTGKAAARDGIEIAIIFKPQPRILYNHDGSLERNRIVFKVQPSAGIIIDISSKVPGGDFTVTGANLAFCYRDLAPDIPDAYLKLLVDAIKGDHTLFVSAEETELAWSVYADALKPGPVESYPCGSDPDAGFCPAWTAFEGYQDYCQA